MAYPFEKMTTEKLNSWCDKRVTSNCREEETNQRREKPAGDKLGTIFRRLQTKRLREINS
jgi:hypothetical protein